MAGDGYFRVWYRTDTRAYAYTVDCTQHSRDADVLQAIIQFLGCGGFYPRSSEPRADVKIQKLELIYDFILPHFSKYPLYNIKQIDFDLFKEAIDILHIKSCRELTVEEKHRLDFIIDN